MQSRAMAYCTFGFKMQRGSNTTLQRSSDRRSLQQSRHSYCLVFPIASLLLDTQVSTTSPLQWGPARRSWAAKSLAWALPKVTRASWRDASTSFSATDASPKSGSSWSQWSKLLNHCQWVLPLSLVCAVCAEVGLIQCRCRGGRHRRPVSIGVLGGLVVYGTVAPQTSAYASTLFLNFCDRRWSRVS